MMLAMIFATMLATAAPAGANAPTAQHLQVARELVEVVTPAAQREQMFETVISSFMANQLAGMMQANPTIRRAFEEEPKLRPVFTAFVERQRRLAMDDLRDSGEQLAEAFAAGYARNFTMAELAELRRFFETSTGAKYASRSAALMTDPALGEWQRGVAARAEARKKEELRQLMDEITPILKSIEQEKRRHGS